MQGTTHLDEGKTEVNLYSKDQVRPNLVKQSEGGTAKVSLTDCLACSGCVTTAETMLI